MTYLEALLLRISQTSGPRKILNRSISMKRRKFKSSVRKRTKKISALVVQTKSNISVKSSAVNDVTSNIKKNVSAIHNVLSDATLQNSVRGNISSTQKKFQELFLPAWILKPFADRERKGVVMDRWWYAWNIVIACMPGLFVLTVTHYYKTEAREFYEKQQMTDRERLINHNTENKRLHRSDESKLQIVQTGAGDISKAESVPNGDIIQGEESKFNELLQRIEFLENRLIGRSEDRTTNRSQSGISKRIDEKKRRQLMEQESIEKDDETIPEHGNLDPFVDKIRREIYTFVVRKQEEIKQRLVKHKSQENLTKEASTLNLLSESETKVDNTAAGGLSVNSFEMNADSSSSNKAQQQNIWSTLKRLRIRDASS